MSARIAAFRQWLGKRVAGVVDIPLNSECNHSWSNWSEPRPVDIKATYSRDWSASYLSEEREGLFQDRRCLKCNIYERRLA